jgi:hypothetical protein
MLVDAPSTTADDRAAPEVVAEEVEAGVLRCPRAIRALAEHDFGLLGVQLEAECPEPFGDGGPKIAGLVLGVAVDNDVVCVTFEGAGRVLPVHPAIERGVHEQVDEQRGDRRTLWGSLLPGDHGPVGHLHGGSEPPWDAVEKGPDVEIEHPALVPAALSSHGQRVVG